MLLTRRQWLSLTTASLGTGLLHQPGTADEHPATPWTIGGFNRPWMRWSYDVALDGLRDAGFRVTGILGDHAGELFTGPDATPDSLDRLKDRIAARQLTPLAGWLRTIHTVPLAEAVAHARRQIDHAERLGLRSMLTVGVDPADQFEHFYQVMRATAAYASDRHIRIVIKPHGGCSADADHLLRCLHAVDHDNFRIWYDAGNIIHYTGKDPVAELDRLAPYVTGLCAKDCAMRGGDVMLQFGTGKVDFAALFRRLHQAGFRGPALVECCTGQTAAEVTAAAKANREFLERQIAAL